MNGHVVEWLGAFLDGELSSSKAQKVQTHLAECDACRSELEALRRVTQMLHAVPAPEFTPVDRFASRLALQLPRNSNVTAEMQKRSLAWWLVPAGLLIVWFFLQAVFTLSDVINALGSANLLGGAASLFSSEAQHAFWFTAAMDLFGHLLSGGQQSFLANADLLSDLGADVLGQFLWQAAVALLYLGWLAWWWFRRGSRQVKVSGSY